MKTLKISKGILYIPEQDTDAICIPVNGIVKQNRCAVMGIGIAKAANSRYGLSYELGKHITEIGNTPFVFSAKGYKNCKLISFPTKDHWNDDADINLIKQSAEQLIELCNNNNIKRCYIDVTDGSCRPLDWEHDLEPVLSPILDDRFIIVFYEK